MRKTYLLIVLLIMAIIMIGCDFNNSTLLTTEVITTTEETTIVDTTEEITTEEITTNTTTKTLFTIVFESNEGSYVEEIIQEFGVSIDEPDSPMKEGYTFIGWYSDQSLVNEYTFTTMPEENITLYAKWEVIEYDILYTLYGGVNETNPSTYNIETNETYLMDASKEGYTFAGWFANEEYTGDRITTIPNGTTGDITLYAKWNLISYDIVYNLDEGINSNLNPSEYNIETNTIILEDPTKEGYTFAGWFSNEELTSDEITDIAIGNTGDIILYAKWELITYSITYNLNGGYTNSSNPAEYDIESNTISLENPTKDGYSFFGWFANEEYTGNRITTIANGTTGDISLYAKWNIESFTINFITNGGTEVDDIIQEYNSVLNEPTPPTKLGYEFAGWYTESDLNNEYVFTTMPFNDTTLYAKWNVVSYSLKVLDYNGTILYQNDIEYKSDLSTISLPNNLTREGYFFVGWDNYLPYYMPANDIVLNAFYEDTNPFVYTITNNEVTITNYLGTCLNVTIPNYIELLPVKVIQGGAFRGKDLESVIIPNTVITIGNYAFSNNNLTSVVIPDSVISIGSYAFHYNFLTSLTLGNSVTTIGDSAFSGNINHETNNIISLVIPDSVVTIGEWAFYSNSLTSLVIGKSVTTIGDIAFDNNYLTELIIPDSVITIGHSAFDNNKITKLVIGNNVETIESWAFNSNYLTSVFIPDSVTKIYYNAFDWFEVDFTFGSNSNFKVENDLLLTIDGEILIAALARFDSVVIPYGVITIYEYAFAYNNLTSLIIPDSVEIIGHNAFRGNELSSLVLGNSVVTIEMGAFAYNNLTSLIIPNSVEIIGIDAFCYNELSSLILGSGVITIEDRAFKSNNLTEVTFPDSLTEFGFESFDWLEINLILGDNSFFRIENNMLLSRNGETLIVALALFEDLIIPEGVITIKESAFENNTLVTVVLPNSLTTIEACAFMNNNIVTVVFPNSLTTIDGSAFYKNSLTSIIIPENVIEIGNYAFYYNDITSVTIEGDVTRFNSVWDKIGFYDIEKPSI